MGGGTFSRDVKHRVWIFGGVLIVGVPAVLILEAPGSGCREPKRVPGWVMRLGRNRCPSVPWVQDPDSSPEPFIEQVVRVIRSTGGKIGTHMLL
jgi:hypothetical protein